MDSVLGDVGVMMTTPLPDICDCVGSNAQAYFNTNPDCEGAPVWVEFKDMKNELNWTANADKLEATPRTKGVCSKSYNRGLRDLEIQAEIGCSAKYEGNALILNEMGACQSPKPKDLLFLSRCILDTGATGWRGCFNLFNEDSKNPQSGNASTAVTFAPAPVCSSCKCEARRVQVDTAGEIMDVVSVDAAKRVQAMTPAIQEIKLHRLVGLDAALGMTGSEVVNVEADDVLFVQLALGNDFRFIKDMLKATMQGEFNNHIALLRQQTSRGEKVSSYIEVNRVAFRALLQEMNISMRAHVNSLKSAS